MLQGKKIRISSHLIMSKKISVRPLMQPELINWYVNSLSQFLEGSLSNPRFIATQF